MKADRKIRSPDSPAGAGAFDAALEGHLPATDDASVPLSDQIGDAPGQVAQLLPVLTRVVSRLIRIHAEGLSPRGLAPRFVRLSPDGEVFIDAAPAGPQQSTVITEPKYSSPEMFREQTADGGSQERSEIYVIGFVFYELLAGRRLFGQEFGSLGADPNAMQWLRWQGDIQQGIASLSSLIPEFPKPLSDLLARMTDKNSAHRPQTLASVLESLITITKGLTVTQQFQTAGVPAKRTRSWVIGPVIALCLALAAAFLIPPFRRGAADLIRPRLNAVAALGGTDANTVQTPTGLMVLISGSGPPQSGRLRFYLDKSEVNNWTYRLFCDQTGRPYPAAPPSDPEYFGKPEYPIRNVPAEDFAAFARWAGKRLPTAVEAAAAAGKLQERRFPWEPDGHGDLGNELNSPGNQTAYSFPLVTGYRCAADPNTAPSSWSRWLRRFREAAQRISGRP